MTISQHFLDKLFIHGEVQLSMDIYKKNFNEIWVCPETFILFLKAEGSQKQKALAIEIAKQIADSSELSLPLNIFKNLVEVEHQGDDRGYIAQDHVVHSVNVYILGIYLFFNYYPLQRELIQYFEKQSDSSKEAPMDYVVSTFIAAWKMFAIYHDIGYVLERAVDGNGYFKESSRIDKNDLQIYRNTQNEGIYDFVKQALSHCLFANCVFQAGKKASGNQFDRFIGINQENWKILSDNILLSLSSGVNDFFADEDVIEVTAICSSDSLRIIAPFIQPSKILVVLKDKKLRPICFWCSNSEKHWVYYNFKSGISEETAKSANELSTFELKKLGFSSSYFVVPKEMDEILPDDLLYYDKNIDCLIKQCYKRFEADFTLLFDEKRIGNILFEIGAWIETQIPSVDFFLENGLAYTVVSDDEDDHIVKNILSNMILEIVNAENIKNVNIESQLTQIASVLNKRIKNNDFRNEFINNCAKEINQNTDSNCQTIILELMSRILFWTKKDIPKPTCMLELENPKEEPESLLVKFKGIQPEIFSCSKALLELETRLIEQAKQLGVEWNMLTAYTTSYSTCDHSIVSGTILLDYLSVYSYLIKKCEDFPMLGNLLKSKGLFLPNKSDISVSNAVEEACFSILLHNIYIYDIHHPYGIAYEQNVRINAFSYFSAFCDSLQFWDRPKLIDLAKTSQPKDTYNGRDFDIRIDGNKIYVLCRTTDARETLQQKINSLDSFLRNASKMVYVIDMS